jgi:hypothetical protein
LNWREIFHIQTITLHPWLPKGSWPSPRVPKVLAVPILFYNPGSESPLRLKANLPVNLWKIKNKLCASEKMAYSTHSHSKRETGEGGEYMGLWEHFIFKP